MPTEQFLNNLIINKVDTAETYEAMKANNLVNEEEIYLIENPVADYIKEVNKGAAQKFWRGTKEEFNAITEKSDDTMYIVTDENGGTVVDQTNADWNENDPESNAYIKNRPFYSESSRTALVIGNTDYGQTPVTIENREVEFDEQGYGSTYDLMGVWAENGDSLFNIGTTYWVVWDGVEYECTAYENENGEGVLGATDGSYPFVIYQLPEGPIGNIYAYDADGNQLTVEATHTVSMYHIAEVVTKIPKKFLPDEAFTTPDWGVNDSNDPRYIQNRPFYTETWFDSFRVGDSYTYEQTITFVDGVADWGAVFGTGVDSTFGDEETWLRITLDGESKTVCFWDDGEKLQVSLAFNNDRMLKMFNHYTAAEPYMELLLYAGYDEDGSFVLETGTVEHVLTIEKEKTYVQTISPEYLTEGKSDWNENDTESAAYIKNKPFGSEYELMEPFYDNEYVWFDDGHKWIYSYENVTFEPGKSYLVEWDGKPYGSFVAWQEPGVPDFVYLGGHDGVYVYDGEPLPWPGGTETPFFFRYEVDGSGTSIYADVRVNDFWERETGSIRHSVVISEVISETITKIDAKYLPDTVATKADIEAAIGAAISASY